MKRFLQFLRWEAILLHRNNLLGISVLVTIMYLALFQLLKLLGHKELFAMLLVLNDPALIGFLFVAITIIFEKESGSLFALRVTPMSLHRYLCAKLVALALLGTICGWAMAVGLVGFGIRHGMFLFTCFSITFLFGCLGIGMVARVKRFVDFMLPMAGALVLMILPLAEWFGLFPLPFKWIFPMEHGIRLMAWSFRYEIQDFPWASLVTFVLSNVGFYAWAYRRFRKHNNH
jgi:fluoroquinolone transport system permease protein